MSWDPKWEDVFRTRGWSRYPLEALVSFVARYYFQAPDHNAVRVLELGCGEGNNLWFLAREGFAAHGIDGSPTAIQKAKRRLSLEGLSADLEVDDVANIMEIYSPLQFDSILNSGCLQHNTMSSVKSVINQTHRLLKPGGRVFSTMIAEGSYGDGLGEEVEPGTFTNITEGALRDIGLCHFFTADEVRELYRGFADLRIDYIILSSDDRQRTYKHWIIEGLRE
jgi:2-polyprenyl-3-methyl-5-hydroxy-6-metoxy-1,4-benzoquinol methylase